MAATLGWSNGNLIFIEACHRDDQHNVMLCVSASMRQSEVLQAKRPAVLLFLHAGVLLRVKQKRVHVTGHKGLLGCNAEHSERSLCKKSLQNLTAMQLGRLIVGIGMLQAAKTRHYHYHPHTQWLRLPSSAWRTPLSHMHVATSPWIQDKVFTTSGSRAMGCAMCGDKRGATDTTCTRRRWALICWLQSRFALKGTRPPAPSAATIRCACFIAGGRKL
jgi:hypothetical protein